MMKTFAVNGAGLGLRRELLPSLESGVPDAVSFFEVSPENWIDIGGRLGKIFRSYTERHTFVAHGLSLSLGGPAPLDIPFLLRLKDFLDEHNFALYTEHLSYCSDEGHHYDLYPIPFTEESVRHVAERICIAQDILERPIALENASYYVKPPLAEMDELTFINAVLTEADCAFHLDANNICVNSLNHNYDAATFLKGLKGERIVYGHVAGHDLDKSGMIIDTHGQAACDPVWRLLELAYQTFGVFPTLLERDFNIPPLVDLLVEVEHIAALQHRFDNSSCIALDHRSRRDIHGVVPPELSSTDGGNVATLPKIVAAMQVVGESS
ncbi:MAG: HvfB family MNIO-type RiPP peptide maturase [Methylobacter sp.]